ncbi:ECF RNA polymerase sigma factor SigK [Mycolicibacterium septicum DSM 44393]|uniref:ECF RNA polymerase sigma factor SigK n=1 Tax=Mycolicibacterium septicum DSM 44393 TaxID=1341646 RepID=A0A7X6RXR9_9MYCO|nr:ECF RNA polymerase sigma factor SigK [Mycolicibacterium septicum]NKZ12951.1 ECF RNA polymerase sigma factor SigK [Mycolicibacterium septicum DSM 44393]
MADPGRPDGDLDNVLRRVARQDAAAFAMFYDSTRARVFGLVSQILRDPGYSEETTQEIYLQVWRNAASFDPTMGSAMAWLVTLAHRRAVDRVRSEEAAHRRDSRYAATSGEPPVDVVVERATLSEEHRQVVDCLDGLSDVQRRCIELAYYRGLTYPQVSERIAVNLATVKSRIRNGLRNLRRCMGTA